MRCMEKSHQTDLRRKRSFKACVHFKQSGGGGSELSTVCSRPEDNSRTHAVGSTLRVNCSSLRVYCSTQSDWWAGMHEKVTSKKRCIHRDLVASSPGEHENGAALPSASLSRNLLGGNAVISLQFGSSMAAWGKARKGKGLLASASALASAGSRGSESEEARVVVGLDFGTTFSGFAFAHRDEPDNVFCHYEWPGQEKSYCKTQTSLYYVREGPEAKYRATHWGWGAQQAHLRQLRNRGRERGPESAGLFLFKFKLNLAPEGWRGGRQGQNWADAEQLDALAGLPEGITTLDCITEYLRKLSEFVIEHLREKYGPHITSRDVQWCLTVPAIWEDSAKQTMRRCAQMAGMATGPYCPPERMGSASPFPLLTVLESEAASVYCARKSSQFNLKKGDQFLVADVGGGTTDIVMHTKQNDSSSDLRLREMSQSSGDLCGGTHVDQGFLGFLSQRIPCFLDEVQRVPATLTKVLKHWLDMKVSFDGDDQWTGDLEIPHNLSRAWQEYDAMIGYQSENYEEMTITAWDMRTIFDPVVDGIIGLIRQRLTPQVMMMLLVGGFSSSPYLRLKVREAFARQLGDRVVIPPDPGSAVCQGAVFFGFSPNVVISRISRRTYGIQQMRRFQPGDPPAYKTMSQGNFYCINTFKAYVRKGQEIPLEDCIKYRGSPSICGLTTLNINIYSSEQEEVRYTTDSGVKLEATFSMDISDDPKKLDLNREVELSMYFGLSCIEVRGRRLNFGDRNEVVVMHDVIGLTLDTPVV